MKVWCVQEATARGLRRGVPPLGTTPIRGGPGAHNGDPGPECPGRLGDEVVGDDGVVVDETDQVVALKQQRTPTPNADTLCDVGPPV
jgi:hypothetical protein